MHAQVIFLSYIWATRGLLIFTSRRHRRRRLPRQEDGVRKFDFCIPPQSTPSPVPRDPLTGAIITSDADGWSEGGVAKCLTRCSKLHLIQRPWLAKWHIVRGASINEAPLPRRRAVTGG